MPKDKFKLMSLLGATAWARAWKRAHKIEILPGKLVGRLTANATAFYHVGLPRVCLLSQYRNIFNLAVFLRKLLRVGDDARPPSPLAADPAHHRVFICLQQG